MEADMATQTEKARMLKNQAQKFIDEKHSDMAKIVVKISELDDACQRMDSLSKNRLSRLEESLRVQEFYLQVEEEEAWIREKEPMASSSDYGKDINSVMKLQQKHQTLEAEIRGLSMASFASARSLQSYTVFFLPAYYYHNTENINYSCMHSIIFIGRQPNYEGICSTGEKLRAHGQLASKTISHRLNQLQDKWKKLRDMTSGRKTRLEEAVQYQQVCREHVYTCTTLALELGTRYAVKSMQLYTILKDSLLIS